MALLVMQGFKKPLLIVIAQKYKDLLPDIMQRNLDHPIMQQQLKKMSLYLGFGLAIHTVAVAYAAFFLSNWWWLFIRGLGLCALLARFT